MTLTEYENDSLSLETIDKACRNELAWDSAEARMRKRKESAK